MRQLSYKVLYIVLFSHLEKKR
ncbi:hypothetical protein LAA29_130162 [Leuconostoc carnosum]|nr:hypothetical protein LAA29_130162 [Leuconostoc carnosum]